MDTVYPIGGMTCGGCVNSLTRALRVGEPALQFEVALSPGSGSLRVSGEHRPERLKALVEDAGFDWLAPAP